MTEVLEEHLRSYGRGEPAAKVPVTPVEKPRRVPRLRAVRPAARPGSVVFSDAETAPPVTEVPQRDADGRLVGCPHPRARVIKGLCGACGRNIGVGGKR